MTSNPTDNRAWAHDFACDLRLEDMLAILDEAGPWAWTQRESYIEGSYLNTRPAEGTLIKLNEHPQAFVSRAGKAGFSVLVRTTSVDPAVREELDRILLELLSALGARDVVAIEPYD